MGLKRLFFERDSVTVSQELLGCFFMRETGQGRVVGKIIETEAYGDAGDLASHARFGPKGRSKIMFGPAGHLYVYSIYGIFELSNIICGKEDHPGAVLLRSVEIIDGTDIARQNIANHKFTKENDLLATGPGKLSVALGLNRSHNGIDITKSPDIYIEKGDKAANENIIETARIGIDYAGESKTLPWRFYIKNNKYVSKPK